jgi:hypothetical protein
MTSLKLTLDQHQPNLFLLTNTLRQPPHYTLPLVSISNKMDSKPASRMATLLRYTSRTNIFFFTAFVGGYALNEYLKNKAAKKIPLAREPGSEAEARK